MEVNPQRQERSPRRVQFADEDDHERARGSGLGPGSGCGAGHFVESGFYRRVLSPPPKGYPCAGTNNQLLG